MPQIAVLGPLIPDRERPTAGLALSLLSMEGVQMPSQSHRVRANFPAKGALVLLQVRRLEVSMHLVIGRTSVVHPVLDHTEQAGLALKDKV